MAAAAADLAANPRAGQPEAAAPTAAPAPTPFPTAAERTARAERTRASRFDWALRIAAVLAIVAVGSWGLNLQRQLDASQRQLDATQRQLEAARRFDAAVASVVQAASQPGAKTVVLAAAKDARASGIAAVGADGSLTLAMRDLVPTTGSQVYETWVIVGKAAPVPVGGFTVDSNGTASFTTRPADTPVGALIALSLEPSEGSTAPQGPIVSLGQAVAPPPASG
jgi:hypothetical protein